ncbi:MAG: hypothetical protein ABI588_09650 [Arenimonas sp.]
MKMLAAALLFVVSPAFAADCLLASVAAANPGMSVVAPEMQRATPADPFCVAAGDALARIHALAAIAAAAAPGAYVPLTKDDNSPWRFDMSQNGKRMTADEFDAWMKAKGIRVAKGRPGAPVAPTPSPPGG